MSARQVIGQSVKQGRQAGRQEFVIISLAFVACDPDRLPSEHATILSATQALQVQDPQGKAASAAVVNVSEPGISIGNPQDCLPADTQTLITLMQRPITSPNIGTFRLEELLQMTHRDLTE